MKISNKGKKLIVYNATLYIGPQRKWSRTPIMKANSTKCTMSFTKKVKVFKPKIQAFRALSFAYTAKNLPYVNHKLLLHYIMTDSYLQDPE